MAISIILTVSVYALSSGLLFYWIGANATFFFIYQAGEMRAARNYPPGTF
ncbi:MAG: hypothetical protein WA632_15115 [Gallionella sp.]